MKEILLSVAAMLFGGGLTSLVLLKPNRTKAVAEAKGSELDNVLEAVKIWRETAESLKKDLEEYRENYSLVIKQTELLRREIVKLTNINKQMVKLLDKITPDNLTEVVDKIKQIHEGE